MHLVLRVVYLVLRALPQVLKAQMNQVQVVLAEFGH
jgi:hypothetical protein